MSHEALQMSPAREYGHIVADLVRAVLGDPELDYSEIRSKKRVREFYEAIGKLDDAIVLRSEFEFESFYKWIQRQVVSNPTRAVSPEYKLKYLDLLWRFRDRDGVDSLVDEAVGRDDVRGALVLTASATAAVAELLPADLWERIRSKQQDLHGPTPELSISEVSTPDWKVYVTFATHYRNLDEDRASKAHKLAYSIGAALMREQIGIVHGGRNVASLQACLDGAESVVDEATFKRFVYALVPHPDMLSRTYWEAGIRYLIRGDGQQINGSALDRRIPLVNQSDMLLLMGGIDKTMDFLEYAQNAIPRRELIPLPQLGGVGERLFKMWIAGEFESDIPMKLRPAVGDPEATQDQLLSSILEVINWCRTNKRSS